MNTTAIGQRAEDTVADYLLRRKFQIITQNWRTRRCEIDIIAYRHKVMYFVEVKYRKSATHGSGDEYITPTKLRQMQHAAQLWIARHDWRGEYTLCVASMIGTGDVSWYELS